MNEYLWNGQHCHQVWYTKYVHCSTSVFLFIFVPQLVATFHIKWAHSSHPHGYYGCTMKITHALQQVHSICNVYLNLHRFRKISNWFFYTKDKGKPKEKGGSHKETSQRVSKLISCLSICVDDDAIQDTGRIHSLEGKYRGLSYGYGGLCLSAIRDIIT